MMKASTIAVGLLAFLGTSASAIVPASAINAWGPLSQPFGPQNFTDTNTVISGDFATQRVTILQGGLFAFIDSNHGPYDNIADVVCTTGETAQNLPGTDVWDANITLVCPAFGNTLHATGSIESD
jgi:hypothetical protein